MMGLEAAEWQVIALSLKVALWTAALITPLSVFTAIALVRWEFRGKALVNGLVLLPLVLPPVVVGYVLLTLFAPAAPIGGLLDQWGLSPAFRWQGAVLAAGIMAFPLTLRAIRLGIEAVDPGLEEAAATLGAGPFRRFWTVTLPLIWPSIVTGALLGFAKALGEFGATITFVAAIPGITETLPAAIYRDLQSPVGGTSAARLAGVAVVLALATVAVSEWLIRRRRA